MKRKKTLDGIRFNEPRTMFAIRHAMTNSGSCCSNNTGTQQQQQRQQHSVCINTCQVYTTARRTAVQYRVHQVLEVRGCETTRCQQKRGEKKKAHQKKEKGARWGSDHQLEMLMERKLRTCSDSISQPEISARDASCGTVYRPAARASRLSGLGCGDISMWVGWLNHTLGGQQRTYIGD